MHKLTGHSSNNSNDFECFASIKEDQDYIYINFKVDGYYPNTKDSFTKDYTQNVGLWNFDVCEAFLSFSDERYLEIQSSPLNQPFSYLVSKPREVYEFPKLLDLTLDNSIDINLWTCSMKLLKANIPGSGKLIGNLFVCLGDDDERYYFSLKPNPDVTADFHRPDLFKELL